MRAPKPAGRDVARWAAPARGRRRPAASAVADLRLLAQFRRGVLPRDAEPFALARSVFDTRWSRRPAAVRARALLQRGVLGPALAAALDLEVRGLERLPEQGPLIFVANFGHRIDPLLLINALPARWRRRTALLAEADTFARRPVAAVAALGLSAFPLELDEPAGATSPIELLEQGRSLAVFPEGRVSPDGDLGDFNPMVALLAQVTGARLVPVGIAGSFSLPGLASLPNRALAEDSPRVSLRFGEPVAAVDGDSPATLSGRVREQVRALVDEQDGTWWQARREARAASPDQVAPWRRVWANTEPTRSRRGIWR